jgi:sensor histidine kinase YesM
LFKLDCVVYSLSVFYDLWQEHLLSTELNDLRTKFEKLDISSKGQKVFRYYFDSLDVFVVLFLYVFVVADTTHSSFPVAYSIQCPPQKVLIKEVKALRAQVETLTNERNVQANQFRQLREALGFGTTIGATSASASTST